MSKQRMPAVAFFHVDLDAFYASVEQRDRPELRGRPVIVGARPGGRGVVAACSYEARAYGIRSAMPIARAAALCPRAVFMPVRMQHYASVSRQVMETLAAFSPEVSQVSIDEAFMDVAGLTRLWGTPEELGRKIRQRIRADLQLTISIGGATTRYVAKLASAQCKPDGLHVVAPGTETEFLATLGIGDLWGVGTKTVERLRQRGITTVRQLQQLDETTAAAMLGDGTSHYLTSLSAGNDPAFTGRRRSHSLSSETTFETDTAAVDVLERTLLRLSHRVMERMFAGAWESRTLVVKIRNHRFATTTIRRSIERPLASAQEVFGVARALLHERWDGRQPLRLLGIGFANLQQRTFQQRDLFDSQRERTRRVEEVVAGLRRDLPPGRITKARLLGD